MLIDFLDNEIEVGDWVVFMRKNYRELCVGRIKSNTKKTILIEHNKRTTKQFPHQVVKIPYTEAFLKML